MTTETMREAVARAIYARLEASVFTPYEDLVDEKKFSCISEDTITHEFLDSIAADAIRTVLERLREPSDAVIEAGATKTWEDGYDRQSSHAANEYVAYEEGLSTLFGDYGEGRAKIYAEEIWQAMLDAAVREVG